MCRLRKTISLALMIAGGAPRALGVDVAQNALLECAKGGMQPYVEATDICASL